MKSEIDNRDLLNKTVAFWDRNPCDGEYDIFQRFDFRYGKEPWLPEVLNRVAQYKNVLEVGCGQGTDALYCCSHMRPGSAYIAIDCSSVSLSNAKQSLLQLWGASQPVVIPDFLLGNAEALQFPNDQFDCVISIGAIHHTPNIQGSIDEVYRVLKPGGEAYIVLYRLFSPKLLGAHFLRWIIKNIDRIKGIDQYSYMGLSRLGTKHF